MEDSLKVQSNNQASAENDGANVFQLRCPSCPSCPSTIPAWRIIPLSKWLGSPFICHLGHLEGVPHPDP